MEVVEATPRGDPIGEIAEMKPSEELGAGRADTKSTFPCALEQTLIEAGVTQSSVEETAGNVGRADIGGKAPLTREEWLHKLKCCTCLKEFGVYLAWGLFAEFLAMPKSRARPAQSVGRKGRTNGLFPLPVVIPVTIRSDTGWSFSDHSLISFSGLATECWLATCCAALNSYYGVQFSPDLSCGRKIHEAVLGNLRNKIHRFLKGDSPCDLSFEQVVTTLKERRISYTGEEISMPLPLSVSQIAQGLPPRGHGASVPLLPFVTGQTRLLLERPLESLLAESERGSAPCQARVHVRQGEALQVFQLLCERGITDWVPSDVAYEDSRGKYLNGLFGVIKPGRFTGSGEPVLRVIMNFIPTNGIFHVIRGDIGFLPSPTAWVPICAETGDLFWMGQSDMQSAFYLFRMPEVWEPYFCFNFSVRGDKIGKDAGTVYHPVCKVLPMGWASSVGIMQQVSRQVLLMKGLDPQLEVQRVQGIPRWFTQSAALATSDRAWWQVYLDNFMSGECSPEHPTGVAAAMHEVSLRAWSEAGILSAADKQVINANVVTELGVRFDGVEKLLGSSPERILKTVLSTLHVLTTKNWNKREVQIVLGRWIFILQFRRAAMGCLSRCWESLEGWQPSPKLRQCLFEELWTVMCLSPLLQMDLEMEYDDQVTCSDASETGGAVAVAEALTWSGRSLVHRWLRADRDPIRLPILVISFFNGIGGSYRVYDILGVSVLGKIAVEISKAAVRVTRCTWDHVEAYPDINLLERGDIQRWANDYARAIEVHVWAGFPCVHLSSVRSGRMNLQGEGSNLFWKLLEVLGWIQDTFSSFCKVKFCVENVASMDEEARQQISAELDVAPVKLDPADSLPYSRPRLAWISEEIYEMEGLSLWTEGDYVRAYVDGPGLDNSQWIRPGWSWDGNHTGVKFPTFMKSIKRKNPPPVPAGLRRATPSMVAMWEHDSFRFPPYQYADKFLLRCPGQPSRLLDSSERELLMGFGPGHTTTCMSASQMKKSLQEYEDTRKSLVGDSFSIPSFAIVGAVLCSELVPRMSPRQIILRLGLAPGASAHLTIEVPMSRWLSYGGDGDQEASGQLLVQHLGQSVNHTGADVRVSTGQVLGKKPQSHVSVRAMWWQWKHLFKTKWIHPSHINFFEMKMILHALLWKVRSSRSLNKRWLHLEDSMVCLLILSKGRTSSHLLQPVARQIGALQLAAGAQLLHGHVGSAENPTDAASRS